MKTLKLGIEEFTVLNKKETEIVKKIIAETIVAIENQIEYNDKLLRRCEEEKDHYIAAQWQLVRLTSDLEDTRNSHKIFLHHLTES